MPLITDKNDRDRLKRMRALGVTWRKGHLPKYPAGLTEEQEAEADHLYDSMSHTFVLYMTTKEP
jgi:hypothetical protein